MEGFVTGVHHINVNCDNAQQLQKMKDFYIGLLGMKLVSEKENSLMVSAGNCLIEIFDTGGTHALGAIRHFALEVSDTKAIVEKVRNAGYHIKMETTRIDYPAIIAFCIGPADEEIEFFQVQNL